MCATMYEMKTIVFATSNRGKVKTLRSHLERIGMDIIVEQCALDLIEPQAATASEVARVKAKQAYEQLRCPVLVDDSSFHIYALGGFPGPYIKYMLETVGADGIVSLMEGKYDRRAYAESALAYIDETGVLYEFSAREPDGHIATKVRKGENAGWGDLWKIFIPAGMDRTLSEMTAEDHDRHRSQGISAYEVFVKWLRHEQ